MIDSSLVSVGAFLEALQDEMSSLGEIGSSFVRRGHQPRRPFLVLSGRPFTVHTGAQRREYHRNVAIGLTVLAAEQEYELSVEVMWDSLTWSVQASVSVYAEDGGQDVLREGPIRAANDVAACTRMLREAIEELRGFQRLVPPP